MAISAMMQHQLEEILANGGALEISARGKMHHALVDLAVSAKRGNSHLTLTDVGNVMHHGIIEIARAGAGHVTFKD
ncbi:TPA: hypothetical protein SMP92_000464 [Pseudomonas putida]|nr:hypothetical protein [Pseudomonas putida]